MHICVCVCVFVSECMCISVIYCSVYVCVCVPVVHTCVSACVRACVSECLLIIIPCFHYPFPQCVGLPDEELKTIRKLVFESVSVVDNILSQ